METKQNEMPNDPNPTILRVVTAVFGKPYLSVRLLAFLIFVIFTDFAYGLMREPAIYWLDYSQDVMNPIVGFRYGPFVAAGICIVYTAAICLLLRILNRRFGFAVWGGLVLLHLSSFILTPPSCTSDMQQTLPGWLCPPTDSLSVAFVIGALLGLILAWGASYEYKPGEGEGRGSLAARTGLSRFSMGFLSVWLLVLSAGVGFSARIPANGWRPVSTEHTPSPRYGAMVSYDVSTGKALLFGGTVEASEGIWVQNNDSWEWDGTDWTHLKPVQSPPARASGALAYDPKRNITVLFGGADNLKKYMRDTWIWDGKNWVQANTCETCYTPTNRGCHNMFYDTVREMIVLYGGCNENQVFYNDAWGWNGETWEYVEVQNSPIASGAPIVYDSKNQWAIGFLAWQPSGTWIWDQEGWSKPILEVEPTLRGNSVMAYDPETGTSLLFGGVKVETSSTTLYADTWAIQGKEWRELKDGLRPPGRWGHVLFFDAQAKKFMLFGGFDGRAALNDMWEISVDTEE